MLREVSLFREIFQIFHDTAGHFPGKLGIVLPIAERMNPVIISVSGGYIFGQHGFQLGCIHFPVAIFMDNMVQGRPDRLATRFLLLGGEAEDKHAAGENVFGKMQKLPLLFVVFHDVADIAGADAQAFRGNHGVLGGNGGIGNCQQQVAYTGIPGLAAGGPKGIIPLFAVSTEYKNHFSGSNERLIVAGLYQLILDGLVGYVQNGVQLLVAGGGRLAGSLQNQRFFFRGNFPVSEDTDGFAVVQGLDDRVHKSTLLR